MEVVGGAGTVQKKSIRARENSVKKNDACQVDLKNIHALV